MARRLIWAWIAGAVAVLLAGANCVEPERVEIRILPPVVELAPGELFFFAAEVHGDRHRRVTWSTTGGDLGASGRLDHYRVYVEYTAPPTDGTFEVRATSVSQPTASAVAEVVVRTPP